MFHLHSHQDTIHVYDNVLFWNSSTCPQQLLCVNKKLGTTDIPGINLENFPLLPLSPTATVPFLRSLRYQALLDAAERRMDFLPAFSTTHWAVMLLVWLDVTSPFSLTPTNQPNPASLLCLSEYAIKVMTSPFFNWVLVNIHKSRNFWVMNSQ